MPFILKLNEFFVEGGRQEISDVLLHITEPSTPEEIERGYFFAICEINHGEPKYIAKLKDCIDSAENNYYSLDNDPNKTPLELVLEKMNQEALPLLKPEVELHCLIGAISGQEITFSYYGHPQMVLFYKNSSGNYQKMDLLDNGQDEAAETSNLFSDVIQGKLSEGDYLFAGTPHIAEYFNHDRLEKIITSRPAAQSAQHIERTLSGMSDGYSFSGLIIHIEKNDAVVPKRAPRADSSQSMNNLFSTEQKTASTLSPSVLPRLNSTVKNMLSKPAAEESPTEPSTPLYKAEISARSLNQRPYNPVERREAMQNILRLIITGIKKIILAVWWVLVAIYSIIYALLRNTILLFFVIINYQKRRKAILEEWRRQWKSNRDNLRSLPTVTKVIFIGIIAVAIAITAAISYYRIQKQKRVAAATFNATVSSIQTKRDAIESSLIYQDTTAVNADYAAATALYKSLVCATPDEKTTCAQIANALNDLSTRIRHVATVTPILLADWSASGAANLSGIVKLNSKIIAYSASTSSLFSYDLLTKNTSLVPTLPTISGFTSAAVPKENDYAAFVFGGQNLLSISPTLAATPMDISYPSQNVTLSSIVIYNRRLYAIDTKNNQIYKHDSIKNGFAQGKPWLQANQGSITNAESLAIDGDMYVVNSDGSITKFTQGAKQTFAVQGLDPALGSNDTIWTYTDTNYLYIIDPKNARLVVLNKDGTLKEQVTADVFKSPTGLVVDDTNNTAYVLDGTKLYQFTIPQ